MEFKIGDTVYFEDSWGYSISDGVIRGFEIDENGNEWASIKSEYGNTGRYLDKLFKTKRNVRKAIRKKTEAKKKEYREMITDVESLIRFMFNKTISHCEDATDYEAREVAIEKTKELLGIKIEY